MRLHKLLPLLRISDLLEEMKLLSEIEVGYG